MTRLFKTLVFPAVLLGICLALGRGADAAIIVSEIMYNPQGTDLDTSANPDIYREWAELYNTGPASVDLTGWSFGDSQDNNWADPFPVGTMLGPSQALVVTGNAAVFDANWGAGINRRQVANFPSLANTPTPTNETAAIRNQLGVIQDQVNFDSANGWPATPQDRAYSGRDGHSIFLLPQGLSIAGNDMGANWQISSHGVYGARWVNGGGHGENHGSPGVVVTQAQAPFAPTPNARWSMVVLPDTQNYVKNITDYPTLVQMTNWIKDHRDEYNIGLVLQEGDIVNQNENTSIPPPGDPDYNGTDYNGIQQWTNARNAMAVLDGVVPYIMAAGNHDIGTTSAQNRNTHFNEYFKPSQNPLNDFAPLGILRGQFESGHLENAYFEVRGPDGRNLLIFALEFWPRQAVVNWADEIAARPEYQDHTAVLLTHSYLNSNNQLMNADPDTYGVGAGGDYNDGIHLWNELVKVNENFEMTFSGHVGGDGTGYLEGTGTEGNTVHQMLINTQFELQGGNGWLRIFEFLGDGMTARVRTYSPFLGLYRTGPEHDYLIDLTQLPFEPADFNHDRSIDGDDFAIWKENFDIPTGAANGPGDADNDGGASGVDFLIWQRSANFLPGLPVAAVPEPAGLALALLAAAVLSTARRSAPVA